MGAIGSPYAFHNIVLYGKVITGAKSESDAVDSYHIMHQKLVPYFLEPCLPHKDKGVRYNLRDHIVD